MKAYIYIISIMIFIPNIVLLANDGFNQNIQVSWDAIDSIINSPGYDPNLQEKIKFKIETESERLAHSKNLSLIEPIKEMAVEKNTYKRHFALSVLVKLGESEPVKKTLLDLIINYDSVVGRDTIYEMAKLNKDFVRDVASNAIKTTENIYTKITLVQLLSAIGDKSTSSILNNIEKGENGNTILKLSAQQAREYLEYRLNVSTVEAQKSWADQAYFYWLLPKEVEDMHYSGIKIEYFAKASLLAARGHVFSKEFLRFHLTHKDPLAIAIINQQKEKELYDDLKVYLNPNEPNSTFKELCQSVLSNNETDSNNNPKEPSLKK